MKRISQGVIVRPTQLPMRTVWAAARHQTASSSSQQRIMDDSVSTTFPGEDVAKGQPSESEGHRHHNRRPHHQQRQSEADGLLRDIFSLEKLVAVEQQRQRLSVRASQLGQTPAVSVKRPRQEAPASSGLAADTTNEEREPPTFTSATPLPVLSVPTAEETASAAERARRLSDDDMPAFAKTAASAPPRPSVPSPPPALQSWAPPFTLTSEHLRSSLEGPASEVAFTLEELEDTLFTSAVEAGADREEEEKVSTLSTTARSSSSSPPPPPPPPPAPSTATPSAPPTTPAASASPPSRAEAAKDSGVDAPRAVEATESTVTAVADAAAHVAAAASPAPRADVSSTPASLREPSKDGATPQPQSSPQPSPQPVVTPVAPVLRCRLRGTAVVVTASRPPSCLGELVEALHEAVTFAESLPVAPLEGLRDVRLRSDGVAPGQATHSFMQLDSEVEAAVTSLEERVRVALLKERLLRRLLDGPVRGLRYVAEMHVSTTTAAPIELRNFAAELVLACAAHEVRHVARPDVRLDGEGRDDVRLSFSGIGVGIFPAPATVLRVARLTETILAHDDQRALLMAPFGFTDDQRESVRRGTEVACATMLCLHLLPAGVSSALLAAGRAEEEKVPSSIANVTAADAVRRWWTALVSSLTQRWTEVRQKQLASAGLQTSKSSTTISLAACVTTGQVWSWLCRAVLRRGATESVMQESVVDALRAAPLQRCWRSYALAHTPFSLPPSMSPSSLPALPPATSTPPQFVMEVSSTTLAQTSVADLASEIREQPSDVVLAVAAAVPLPQRLKFLASLHLTDTGSHHRVTVLLSGAPHEIDECASLTRSSARLVAPRTSGYGPTTRQLCDASWLHETVEVSQARGAVGDASGNGTAATEVATAVRYISQHWHRPCVVTAKSEVGLALQKAAQTKTSQGQPTKEHYLLFPLVLLGQDAASVAKASGALGRVPAAVGFGLTFLTVLDAACQALCREAGATSPAHVNVLSIAALRLDASAGGIFDAADRACGGDVEGVLTAMEGAAAAHALSFPSLPLLRWMVEEGLLFYQLDSSNLARFAKSLPKA